MMIVQFLPVAIVGPLAGVVVDRVNRRRLMIVADLVRGVLILGLLLVRRSDQVWIAYVVMALTVAASAFFEPARTATIPNVTSAEELLPANALSARHVVGDAGASARRSAASSPPRSAATSRSSSTRRRSSARRSSSRRRDTTRRRATPRRPRPSRDFGCALTGIADLVDGLRYVRGTVARGGADVREGGLGPGRRRAAAADDLRPARVSGRRQASAAGIGVLYGARGIGAGLGPIALRWILGQQPARAAPHHRPRILHGRRRSTWRSPARRRCRSRRCACCCAHFGGSILWVFSTVLLQMEVPDRFRGRVFAAELALVTLITSLSSYWTGVRSSIGGAGRRARCRSRSARCSACPASLWLLIQSRWQDHGRAPGHPIATPSAEESALKDASVKSRVQVSSLSRLSLRRQP